MVPLQVVGGVFLLNDINRKAVLNFESHLLLFSPSCVSFIFCTQACTISRELRWCRQGEQRGGSSPCQGRCREVAQRNRAPRTPYLIRSLIKSRAADARLTPHMPRSR